MSRYGFPDVGYSEVSSEDWIQTRIMLHSIAWFLKIPKNINGITNALSMLSDYLTCLVILMQ